MEDNKKSQQEGGVSLALLREILAEQSKQNAEQLKIVIEELKKPTVLEQKKLDEEAQAILDRNQERKENAAGMLKQIENKKFLQSTCSHKHRNGGSHCVLVQVQNQPEYILCQLNQCKIRAGVAPPGYTGMDIYSTQLFNELYQTLPSNELFG